MKRSDPLILLTGATGYVGREFVHLLEGRGGEFYLNSIIR